MNVAELRLTYWSDEEYVGQINASVRSGQFSAVGAAWFDRIDVKKTFLAALRKFPLSADDPATLESGFWGGENPKRLDQCLLRVRITPYDSRGTLLVRVDVATEVWRTPDIDLQNSASVCFRTEYALLDKFANDFEQVLDGKREVAVLKGIVG